MSEVIGYGIFLAICLLTLHTCDGLRSIKSSIDDLEITCTAEGL
jgi:hypothetical protein